MHACRSTLEDPTHGAAAALSPALADRVAGIERADSVVWDAHKMLFMPALVSAVLFRDERHARAAFAQDAAYLFDDDDEAARWDVGRRTLECTKRMMAMQLYAVLRTHGEDALRECVERCFGLAARFADRMGASVDFEVATAPEGNVVCFRHRPAGVDPGPALDALQERARARIVESGAFYLVRTRLAGATWLRTAIMNPLTRDEDLDALLAAVRAAR